MKKYSKRQILESIKYWKKQLNEGNYKKLNEGISADGAKQQFEEIMTSISDYPAETGSELIEWSKDYGSSATHTNLDIIKDLSQQINFEHGDIEDGEEDGGQYLFGIENGLNELAYAIEDDDPDEAMNAYSNLQELYISNS